MRQIAKNMAQDSVEVGPGDVTFLEELKESECSVVFKVLFRGTTSVMKVVCTTLLDNLGAFFLIDV